MAYQAKRHNTYTEEFELVNEFGEVVHTLHVSIDPGSMVEKLSGQYTELLRTQTEIQSIDPEEKGELIGAYQKLGNAVIAILKSVFGDDDTEIILEFYNNRYNEMALEVMPFITDVVIPKIREITQQNRKSIQQKYNRKQRLAFKKVK